MTIQATPPLPDPLTGRLPQYTQVLQQNNNGQWVVMYDVANIQTTSTTGTVTPIGGTTTPTADPGFTTPITEFPDPTDPDQSPITDPVISDPQPYIPPIFEGGGGRDSSPNTGSISVGPFSGDYYDGETGERLGDVAQAVIGAFQNFTTIGAVSKLNALNDFVTKDLAVQQSILASEAEQTAMKAMPVAKRGKRITQINKAADRNNTTAATAMGSHSGVGLAGFGNINAGMPDAIGTGSEEGRSTDGPRGGAGPHSSQNISTREAMTARDQARANQSVGGDTNAGGVSSGSTGTGGSTPGPHGQRGGTPDSAGNAQGGVSAGSTGTGGQSPGPHGQRGGSNTGGGGQNGGNGNGNGGGMGGATGGGFCFDPETLVEMLDGTEKKIKHIVLGDKTRGGEVTGVFQFKAADEIHDYKGVTVAGSHYVKENGNFIMVQDSPLSVKINKIPVVYSLDTTQRRIWIKDIEFADYNGDGIAKDFLANAGVDLTGFDKEVLRQVENRLI